MRLIRKLTLAMVLGMVVVLAIHGWLRVRRDAEFFAMDMRRDHQLPGRVLGAAIAETWRSEGRERALRIIDDTRRAEGHLHIRWIDGPASGTEGLSGGSFRSYVPVTLEGRRLGTIEITESFAEEAAYIRASAVRTVTTTIIMAGVAAALAVVLGMFFVGRPMLRLTEKARRVGLGDLSGPLDLHQHDEIGELAREMNAMCDRLAEAKEHIAAETAARLVALEQLRHADRLATVGKLASGVAHELGTPLNVVAARAKMIAAREGGVDEMVKSARIVGEQTDRMIRIIRELLDFARGRGTTKAPDQFARKEPVDLRALAAQTLELLRPLAEKSAVSLDLRSGQPATAVGDAGQLQQVLTNLVVNAIQSMRRPGAIVVEIDRGPAVPPADQGSAAGDYLHVAVVDQGEGIPADLLPHVFEPFFTTKEVGEGTGLGLSVSYGIVREHGGWIAAESRPGAGSRFTVYLPERGA